MKKSLLVFLLLWFAVTKQHFLNGSNKCSAENPVYLSTNLKLHLMF